MNFFLIGEINGQKAIFGAGNTRDDAWYSGRWDVYCNNDGKNAEVVVDSCLPEGVKWWFYIL